MDHMREAIKRHIGKSKHPGDKDESDKGSQKGPGETDHAPSLDKSADSGGIQEMANPSAVMAPPQGQMMGSPHGMPQSPMMDSQHGMQPMMLGPEHLEALKHLISQGGVGFDAKAAASAKEKYASIQKHKEK